MNELTEELLNDNNLTVADDFDILELTNELLKANEKAYEELAK